ncbi:hypothetical protein EDM68_04570 [Candidatus Uhrbacteria bacterium]|nr:MAG: hypothetical protein EDM68_04570 [Candidatus Uhrbacteria bacterium]
MTSRRDPTPAGTVSSTKLDLLKYEMFSLITTEELTPVGVGVLAAQARLRFNHKMVWSIGASGLKRISREAREPLVELFNEFRAHGGILIVVIGAPDGFVGSAFQTCAYKAGNVPLKSVKDASEASKLIDTFRAQQSGAGA